MPDEISKALKRIEGETKVYTRGGKTVKIFAQEIKSPLKDGVQIVYVIPNDIVDTE